jgi:hypothetical protein
VIVFLLFSFLYARDDEKTQAHCVEKNEKCIYIWRVNLWPKEVVKLMVWPNDVIYRSSFSPIATRSGNYFAAVVDVSF